VAAAQEVIDGRQLSHRSRWAIEHAASQLKTQRAAITGSRPGAEPAGRVALIASATDKSPQLSSLILDHRRGHLGAPGESKVLSAAELDVVITDVEELSTRDRLAAERVSERLSKIAHRLLAA
jgi:hypothetical protein